MEGGREGCGSYGGRQLMFHDEHVLNGYCEEKSKR